MIIGVASQKYDSVNLIFVPFTEQKSLFCRKLILYTETYMQQYLLEVLD